MTRSVPGILDPGELEAVRAEFGVADIQVRRDHLISHALAAIASIDAAEIEFFGGTALCRTHLPHHRLSEDIDLVALTRPSGDGGADRVGNDAGIASILRVADLHPSAVSHPARRAVGPSGRRTACANPVARPHRLSALAE